MSHSRAIGRRTAISALGAATLIPPAMAAVPNARGLDPVKDIGLINMKLRYRSDDGLVFWWLTGTKIGQIDAAARPLFDMQVGSIHRIVHKPDGGFEVTSLEIVFYTDIDSGAWLKRWTNPYTNATVDVAHAPLGPSMVAYRADGSRPQSQREVGGSVIDGRNAVGQVVISGDDVWVRSDSTASVSRKSGPGRPFLVNDWSIYHGSVADVLDPAKTYIPATSHLQEITSWTAWMGMGDRPGNQASRSVGAKARTYAEMPERWRALMAEAHPEIAKDPIAALDKPAAKFER